MDGATSVDGATSMATEERQPAFPLLRYEFCEELAHSHHFPTGKFCFSIKKGYTYNFK